MNAQTFTRTLTIQYGYNTYVFKGNLAELSDADALRQPAPGGNCLNWVVGHIVGSRAGTLEVLGQPVPFAAEKYKRYERGSASITNPEGTVGLAEMIADYEATDAGLQKGLAALTDEMLLAKAPFSPSQDEKETNGSLLAGLVFHEAYHNGQLGVLRRVAGAPGVIK